MRSNIVIGTVLVRFNIGINDLMNSLYYTFLLSVVPSFYFRYFGITQTD